MINENNLVPSNSEKTVPKGKTLVLAPHPDDEVFGCGGAIIKHILQGDEVKVIIVTDGGFPVNESQKTNDYPEIRKQESLAAAKILGSEQPQFFDFKDGFLQANEELIASLLKIIREFQPHNVYLPSETEIHPDHIALNKAGIEAAKRFPENSNLFFYEIGQPLRPNFFLDITVLQPTLEEAMDCFVSQLAVQDYKTHLRSLHAYRSYTLGKDVKFAEAYRVIKSDELKTGEALWHEKRKTISDLPLRVNSPDEFPLISVIVRTMNRPELPEALESISLQTYPNLEVIVVDARGEKSFNLGDYCGNFPLYLISKNTPLNRPEAANAGLDVVKGEFFCFLDEDDLMLPDQVMQLYQILCETNAPAAYSAIERVNRDFEQELLFDFDFDFVKLIRDNYIPNLALLFRVEILKQGCRFDPLFEVYEDWDFVLQAAQFGDFVFVNKKGGYYRNLHSSDLYVNKTNSLQYRKKVLSKWVSKISDEQFKILIPVHQDYDQGMLLKEKSFHENKTEELIPDVGQIKQKSANTKKWTFPGFEIQLSTPHLLKRLKNSWNHFRQKMIETSINIQIRQSGLFDRNFYLENNPDVRAAGVDPLLHYLRYGGFEGRNPSEKFDCAFYLEQNTDVAKNGVNPLVHYVLFGKKEGRRKLLDCSEWQAKVRSADATNNNNADRKRHLEEFSPLFLIIAETSIQQCTKYRVNQKLEMLQFLGYRGKIVNWRNTREVLNQIQICRVAIFYRVPATREMLIVLDEAKLLGVTCYFELDDLIFDLDLYGSNPNLKKLDAGHIRNLMNGAQMHRDMMKACKNVIASTKDLAARMQQVTGGQAFVLENNIDRETLELSEALKRHRNDGRIQIFYGSGTSTHDVDFLEAVESLIKIIELYDVVDIILVGEIVPPDDLLWKAGDRIKVLHPMPFSSFMATMKEADIAIAPLANTEFNDAKSNIKFLEASVLGIPSVCSPRVAFRNAISHGENGFLADTPLEWFEYLNELVRDSSLRQKMGENARLFVQKEYDYRKIANELLLPFCSRFKSVEKHNLRVLVVNVFFAPYSHGGATLVAEEMTRYFVSRNDTSVAVFTTFYEDDVPHRKFIRTTEEGIPVFGVVLQNDERSILQYQNSQIDLLFNEALQVFRPDVVHFHSVQYLGAGIANVCRKNNILYVITLHDAWWLCEKHFLIKDSDHYCGQKTIRWLSCADCVDNVGFTVKRTRFLKEILNNAEILLTPSDHWRDFYIANGIEPSIIRVNKNGISIPQKTHPNIAGNGKLRFGFVAGNEKVKGFIQVKAAFESLQTDAWELIIVDHSSLMKNGKPFPEVINAKGKVRIVAKYTKTTIDKFFDSIDVLLFPTQYPESFGLTVREALIRNKWVIATNGGGVAEAIHDGINGTLIPMSPDPSYLQKAVEELLSNPERLKGWVNPFSHNIRSFEEQAIELQEILRTVV